MPHGGCPRIVLVALPFVVAAGLRVVLSTKAQQYVTGNLFEKTQFEIKVLFELKRVLYIGEKIANKGSTAMICLKKPTQSHI